MDMCVCISEICMYVYLCIVAVCGPAELSLLCGYVCICMHMYWLDMYVCTHVFMYVRRCIPISEV